MLTPEMIEFAKTFGFPALLVVAGGWLVLRPLMATFMEYVKESKGTLVDVSKNVQASTLHMESLTETTKRVEQKLDTHIDETRRSWQQRGTA